jgi:hypothetical protein
MTIRFRTSMLPSVRSHERWALGILILIGGVLRLIDLGTLSFRWDEDLTSLAVKAIAAQGVPELPSGMMYVRGLAFLYLLTGSALLFGFSEWALRLPAALFGIAMIPLAFVFGKRLFGSAVGLTLAALITFSAWDVEFSRYARMYAPFSLFYLLTLAGIWRYRVVEQNTAGGVLCVASALIAISLHDLGYTLAIAFVIPALMQWRQVRADPRRALFPALAFLTTAGAFFVWRRIQSRLFYRAQTLSAEQSGGDMPLAGSTVPSTETAGGVVGIVRDVWSQLELPHPPAFSALMDSTPLAAAAILAAALVIPGLLCIAWRRTLDRPSWVLVPLVALFCGVQLFNLALLATLALAATKLTGIRAFRSRDVMLCIGLIAAFFALWLGLSLRLDLIPADDLRSEPTRTIRALLNYPSFFVFWGYPREYPLLFIPALLGGAWAFDRAARPQPDRAALYLLAVFAIPTILNGMFETRYQQFRYNVPFGPLYFTLIALGIVRGVELIAAWAARHRASPLSYRARTLITSLLVALVFVFDMNPLRSWLVAKRAYSNEGQLYSFFGVRGFSDYRSVVDYVQRNRGDDDVITTFDCREYFNYLGHVDYCLVSGTYRDGDELIQMYIDGGQKRDLYVATPLIMNADELERMLQDAQSTVWLLSAETLASNPRALDEGFRRFLAENADRVVHVARDGDTKVYRFPAEPRALR